MNALRLAVGSDQRVEDRQHVAPVIQHALENIFQLRIALGFAVPFGEDRAGHLDIAPQLVGRMAAQEQAIEKCGLALGILEILQRIDGNELWHRGHKENAVYPKVFPRQVGLMFSDAFAPTLPFLRPFKPCRTNGSIRRCGMASKTL